MATTLRLRRAETSAGPACCPSGLSAPLDRDTARDLAQLLKAVADPARLQLLALIKPAIPARLVSATSPTLSGCPNPL